MMMTNNVFGKKCRVKEEAMENTFLPIRFSIDQKNTISQIYG
jgi:hypothetical protein